MTATDRTWKTNPSRDELGPEAVSEALNAASLARTALDDPAGVEEELASRYGHHLERDRARFYAVDRLDDVIRWLTDEEGDPLPMPEETTWRFVHIGYEDGTTEQDLDRLSVAALGELIRDVHDERDRRDRKIEEDRLRERMVSEAAKLYQGDHVRIDFNAEAELVPEESGGWVQARVWIGVDDLPPEDESRGHH